MDRLSIWPQTEIMDHIVIKILVTAEIEGQLETINSLKADEHPLCVCTGHAEMPETGSFIQG